MPCGREAITITIYCLLCGLQKRVSDLGSYYDNRRNPATTWWQAEEVAAAHGCSDESVRGTLRGMVGIRWLSRQIFDASRQFVNFPAL